MQSGAVRHADHAVDRDPRIPDGSQPLRLSAGGARGPDEAQALCRESTS